jgi:hypothetical protein
MEQLAILEKICDNIFDSLEPRTAIYIFAAAIYDTWCTSNNKLENNLAKRLVNLWETELTNQMYDTYKKPIYQEYHLDFNDYYKKWLESSYILYNNNKGIQCALAHIWKLKYGLRVDWPHL